MKIEIETKYNIGDIVYYPHSNSIKVITIIIKGIRIIIRENNTPCILYIDSLNNSYVEEELFLTLLSAKIVKIEKYKKELEKNNPV